jgi:phospholipase C
MSFRRFASSACLVGAISMLAACHGGTNAPSLAPGPQISGAIQTLVSLKVKHVFVIVQENHTFDNYFVLYPGTGNGNVENLGSSAAQAVINMPDPFTGGTQKPFLITTNKANAAYYTPDAPDIWGSTGSGGNNRFAQLYAIDGGKEDRWLLENETPNVITGPLATKLPANPTTAQITTHNQALQQISVFDCDTVPYLWYYAKNFALFDHYFQGNAGQSTEGNTQLFAGQIGQTQLVAGKATTSSIFNPASTGYSDGLPLEDDSNPPPSKLAFIQPYTGDATQSVSFASLPVLMNPTQDAGIISAGISNSIPNDLKTNAASGRGSVPWVWYEEGTTTTNGAPTGTGNLGAFNAHHEAPLYFDYVNNASSPMGTNTYLRDNTYAGQGLLSDIKNGTLPASGVFWVKGGSGKSTFPFHPADQTLNTLGLFQGTDDHAGSTSSDHQVAEAYLATVINAIANSTYWNDSVILVTWDDGGGLYDHLAPQMFGSACPVDNASGDPLMGLPCGDGVRLPFLLISPFAKNGVVVNDYSDTGSVMKFIETVFSLPTLGSQPDEAAGVTAGLAPVDINSAVSDLTSALDPNKLSGVNPNAAGLAQIPSPSVPPSMSCSSLGMTPIASPATPPPGFQTQGANLSTTPVNQIRLPAPALNDDDT